MPVVYATYWENNAKNNERVPAMRYGERKVGLCKVMSSEFVHGEQREKRRRQGGRKWSGAIGRYTEQHYRNTPRKMTTGKRYSSKENNKKYEARTVEQVLKSLRLLHILRKFFRKYF